MLASRVLPPIIRTSPPSPLLPVATFLNVPRRYIRSTMQTEQISPPSLMDDTKPSRNLRKSNRIQETRSASISDATTEQNHEEEPMSASASSPRIAKKRLTSLVEASESEESGSPTDEKPPPSAASTTTGSPDFVGHVCLCQPEPKIPRPRNGEFEISLSCSGSFSNRIVIIRGLDQNKGHGLCWQKILAQSADHPPQHLSFIGSTISRLLLLATLVSTTLIFPRLLASSGKLRLKSRRRFGKILHRLVLQLLLAACIYADSV
jgi:hypothetical protein